jgi:hypothetical protein
MFRGCAIAIHLGALIRNVLSGGYPKLVSRHQMYVPDDPTEPSTLHLRFHLVYTTTVQSLSVRVLGGYAVGDIGFEVERPRIAVDGYTLTDYQILNRVETEETMALSAKILASVERYVLWEGRRNPKMTAAIT